MTDLLHVGFGANVATNRVVVICDPDSAPIRRMVRRAKENGTATDVTYGRRMRSVIVMDTGHIVVAALRPETIARRLREATIVGTIGAARIVTVSDADSAPIKRMVQQAREEDSVIDVTYGRRVKTVIVLDTGHVVLAALQPETIAGRLQRESLTRGPRQENRGAGE